MGDVGMNCSLPPLELEVYFSLLMEVQNLQHSRSMEAGEATCQPILYIIIGEGFFPAASVTEHRQNAVSSFVVRATLV